MELSKARELLQKYKDGTLTPAEQAMLDSWYLDLAKTGSEPVDAEYLEANLDQVWNALPVHHETTPAESRKLLPVYWRMAAAASVIFILGMGAYLFYAGRNNTPTVQTASSVEIAPGTSKALLTLANGSEIVLDRFASGQLAKEGNTSIVQTNVGQIVYQASREITGNDNALAYNTIATPKAGQFQVTLPDGTKVWLNAQSSIRFPTAFPNRERIVEITGEVYFEVAHMKTGRRKIPFKVLAGRQLVEVLGTRFNINSYQDEGKIKTTLLEGSIKVHASDNAGSGILLRPGQQSQLPAAGKTDTADKPDFGISTVDAGAVVAWKDGFFRFDNAGLPELMRQLARWYDMDVVYRGPVGDHEFVGQIERSAPLSKVLRILEMGDVHFRVEGKTIIVNE